MGGESQLPDNNQYNDDIDACHAEHGYPDDAGYTPEHAERFFDLSWANADCLRDLGYDISDPPSRQSFVEALVNNEPPPWFPHLEALAQGGSNAELEAACPQPGIVMDSE